MKKAFWCECYGEGTCILPDEASPDCEKLMRGKSTPGVFLTDAEYAALTASAPLPACDVCRRPQTERGAVAFSPPDKDGKYSKRHICATCWAEGKR
jgi:hypothetical protein